MRKPQTLCLSLLFATALSLQQDSAAVELGQSQQNQSQAATPTVQNTQYDTVQPQFSREQWGLDEREWTRYQGLRQGIRGSFSQANLSPLEVLGIHAETPQERRAYAARLAKLTLDDTERVLAFARVYQEEAAKLTRGAPVIDMGRLGIGKPAGAEIFQDNDRILFFARTVSCPECSLQLGKLMAASANKKTHLDIFLVDARDDQAIRAWERQQNSLADRLKAGTATLNYDKGTLAQVLGPSATAPAGVLVRGKALLPINLK